MTHIYSSMAVALLAGAASATGCADDQPSENPPCTHWDFFCRADGIRGGNANISSVNSVDRFFVSVVDFRNRASLLSDSLEEELGAVADSVGLEGGAAADFLGGFQAALQARFALNGPVSVAFAKPKCSVSAKAAIDECDYGAKADEVMAECAGSCTALVKKSGESTCSAGAELRCTGTAPGLDCVGTCTGACNLDVAGICEGTCIGTCNGTCSVENVDGSCGGECDGDCQGLCELTLGGRCTGQCKGSCEYLPPSGQCENGARAECQASTGPGATVPCLGSCSGEVTPPPASAECEASASVRANVNIECAPPPVQISYQLTASGDAAADRLARAEFEAWLSGFEARMGAIAALQARAAAVVEAGLAAGHAATGSVTDSVDALLESELYIETIVRLGCSLIELEEVPRIVTEANTRLEGAISGTVSLTRALNGG